MIVFDYLKNLFLYAGLEKEEFQSAKELFHIENRKMLIRMAMFLAIVIFILVLLSFVVESAVLQKNRAVYTIVCVVEFTLAFLPYKFGLKFPRIVLPLCYVFGVLLYAFGIVVGTMNLTDAPTVTFVVLCASVPMMFYDHPVRCNFVTVLAAAVYLLVGSMTKEHSAFITDFIDIATFGVAGIFLNLFIMQSRAHCLTLTQHAEKQKNEILKLNDTLVVRYDELEKSLEKERRDNNVISGLGNLFYAIYVIDLKHNTFREITTNSKIQNVLSNVCDARSAMRLITEKMVANEDKTEVAVFNNFDTVKERLRGKSSLSIEYEGISIGWSRAMLVPIAFDENGDVSEILYTTRLINEERKSNLEQEHIRNIYASMNSALWNIEFDMGGEISLCYWSSAFRRMLGFETEKEFPAVLESWTNLIYESDKPFVLQKFWSAINDPTNSSVFDVEFRMQKKNGDFFWFHSAGRITRRTNGSPISFIGVCVDINDRKKMEEKIASQQMIMQNALVDAQRANNAKTTFLNKLSHDVRIPMNSILGFVELAKTNAANSKLLSEYLDKISVSTGYMRSLVDDILDISRIESGTYELESSQNNLCSILREIEILILPEIQSRNLKFRLNADLKNEDVLCDKNRLIQIVLNLLGSSMNISKPGEEIELGVRQNFAPQNGIAFYDIHVRNILLNSELVLRVNFEVCSKQMGASEKVACNSKDVLKNKRILLVEDDSLNCEIERTVLEMNGCIVEIASNGAEAVEKVKNAEPESYDAILMDIQMPVMDGYTATREIRNLKRSEISSLPIVALTANVTEEEKLLTQSAGMDGHVGKPIDVQNVAAVIASLVKN